MEIEGELPANATVTYTNNKATQVGEYSVTAKITADGYAPLILSAKLTVKKATFTGISFPNQKFIANGQEKEILIAYEGQLPEGTTVTYKDNKASQPGTYEATATISNPNYEPLSLRATMTIHSPVSVAVNTIVSMISRPDPWTFLPEAFAQENMACETLPPAAAVYEAGFVDVDAIPDKMIGKQMNVVYTTLNNTQFILEKADLVFDMANTVAEFYQAFVNENPDNTAAFTGEVAGFTFTLMLDDKTSTFEATNGTVSATLTYCGDTDVRTGYIRLTDGTALRYESGQDNLRLAYAITISDVGYLTELSFARNQENTVGHLHEYLGSEATALKTSALIQIDDDYTRIISDKRETDDLSIDGYQEVYSSTTGKMMGAEVAETVKSVQFDTLWFNLHDISHLENVMMVPQANELNLHSVYVNNSSELFTTKKVGGLSLDTLSRRYDIEMKDVFYVVAETQDDRTVYKTVRAQIPMLFVQKANLSTLGSDIMEKNAAAFSVMPAVKEAAATSTTALFDQLLPLFAPVQESNTYKEILYFIEPF